MGQKTTSVKAFPSRRFGGPLISEGHRDVLPPKATSFGSLGGPNTSSEIGTSKKADKLPLGDRPDSPKLGTSTRAAPVMLCVGQLKMDMPPVFTATRQKNVRD